MRYEVRIIMTPEQDKVVLGRTRLATDDASHAKAYASKYGTEEYFGLAICDTESETVNLGDRNISLKDTREDLEVADED